MKKKKINSRRKGHQFERNVAIEFRKIFPGARRHLEYHEDDANGVDLIGTKPFLIQCKRGRKLASINKIFEIQIDPIDGGIPLLITQGDNTDIYAALPLHFFLRMVKLTKGRL